MKLLLCYLKQRWRLYVVAALFVLIFIVSFGLYHLPILAVLYPMLLCLVLGIVATALDFWKVRRNHKMLDNIKSITDVVECEFPVPEGVEDLRLCRR